MVSWSRIEAQVPELARRVRESFQGGRHKTLATVRADGSPRISGIECEFTDGEVTFGSMLGARKLDDLARDPRFAMHAPPIHPAVGQEGEWRGEAKISGRAVPADPVTTGDGPEPDGQMFTADIDQVTFTGLNAEGTMLVVEWWSPSGGLRRVERS